MKCVQVIGQGVAVRFTDRDAELMIAVGDGQYCSKSIWRHWGKHRPYPNFEAIPPNYPINEKVGRLLRRYKMTHKNL